MRLFTRPSARGATGLKSQPRRFFDRENCWGARGRRAAAGGKIRVFGLARTIGDVNAVVRTMREHGIQVIGPFRRRNGTLIYGLAGCVVTEHEILDLAKAGKLDATGVAEL